MKSPDFQAPAQAVILIGGLGTRLGELTKRSPKPLLPVGDRPFLDYMIENCIRFGFRKILLLAGYLGEQVEQYVSERRAQLPGDVELSVAIEPEPRGTAGALRFAGDRLDSQFLLLNGDSFFDFNWLDLVLAVDTTDAVGVMTLRRVADNSRYGSVTVQHGIVTSFAERGSGGEGLINGGVYLLDRNILELLPESGSLEREVLPQLSLDGKIKGRIHDGFFIDIGVPTDLQAAQSLMPARRQRRAVFFDRDGTLNHDEGYTHKPDSLVFLPGAVATVKRANDLGYFVFLVTNQAGVARGFYAETDVQLFHAHLQRQLRNAGAHLDDIRYCPDHPDGTVPPYNRASPFRKPAPGMLLELMDAWPVIREGSFVVGDRVSDVEAAAAAGLPGVLYGGGDLDRLVRPLLVT